MLISALPWAVVGAGLVLLQGAEAAPIRVVTVVTHQEWSGTVTNVVGGPDGHVFRLGHAMSSENAGMRLSPGPAKPCRMKNGKGSLSDTIRKALGLPPIEHHRPPPPIALPLVEVAPTGPGPVNIWKAHPHPPPMAPTGDNLSMEKGGEDSFLHRIRTALLQLDTWEARAVAFVLGCGIGVLFRMVWVFIVLIFRGLREESADTMDSEYTLVIEQVDEALPKYDHDIAPAPAYTDEKKETTQGA